MTRATIRSRAAVALIPAALFLLSAFGWAEAQVSPAVNAPNPDGITVQATVLFGPGAFHFSDLAAGLGDLASYKATLSLSFSGTQDGQPSQWSQTYGLQAATEPFARQLTIEKTGRQADPDPVFMAVLAGVAYERRGEGECAATAMAPGDAVAAQMEPVGLLGVVIGAEEAGAETVNGVAATRYTFDERALGLTGTAASTGEIWVAAEGGYVVRYVLTTTGTAAYFGAGIEGTAIWVYDLTDLNQPVAVELPIDCPSGMVDAPLLADAANIVSVPSLLSYSTLTPMAEAVAFYQEQLPALGWRQAPDPFFNETTALLDFTRTGEELRLVVATGAGGTTVQLALSRMQ